ENRNATARLHTTILQRSFRRNVTFDMAQSINMAHPLESTLTEIDISHSPGSVGLNLIGARWVPGCGAHVRSIRNPADTSDLVAAVREVSAEQADETCVLAAKVFPAWAATPAPDRARVLFRYRELLEKHFNELSELIVRENGKLLSEARGS